MKPSRAMVAVAALILIAIAFYFYSNKTPVDQTVEKVARIACDSLDLPKGENIVHMDITGGCVVIKLFPKLAPGHTKRISELANKGFYDGIVFHRVIAGFMAQAGDPTGTGSGGSDLPDLKAEFSNEPFTRGVLGMARTSNPDSANSQFFIVYGPASHLNRQYTVFGRVIGGMEYIDGLKKGTQGNNGLVSDPDKIIKMQMAVNS